MSVQVEKLEGSMAKLTIEVPAEDFEAAIERTYQKEKGKISVPGFRKGKVPRKMIEQMYGKEVFYEGAINDVIPDAYDKAYEECEEDIVSSPSIEVAQAEAGKPMIFTATVALKPPVELGEYKGLEVPAQDITVSDEDVDKEIKRQQELQARTISVTDRAVQNGDQVVLDFEGFVDGVAFQGGKGEDYDLTIGSGQFIPGFEDALVGAEIGKEVDVNVTFPEDYQASDLAGKPAVFKCTVKEIKAKELPEVDEEFAQDAGFDTVKDYRESVKSDIETKKLSDAKSAKQDAVVEKIVENAKMEIPDAMLETEQRTMIRDFAQQLSMQGLRMQQYMSMTGMTEEKLMEQVKPQALQRIQSRLVLEAIADAENIQVSDEDLTKEMETMAEAYQIDKDKVKDMLGESGVKQVSSDLRIRKALEFAADQAKEV